MRETDGVCPNCGNKGRIIRYGIEQCDECGYPTPQLTLAVGRTAQEEVLKIYLPVPDLEEGHCFEPPAKDTLWRVVGYSAEEKLYIIFESAQQSVQRTAERSAEAVKRGEMEAAMKREHEA